MQNQLSQQFHLIMEKLPNSLAFSAEFQSKSRKKEDEENELWKLLKKTQLRMKSLENEISRVEAKNIHQGRGSAYLYYFYNTVSPLVIFLTKILQRNLSKTKNLRNYS